MAAISSLIAAAGVAAAAGGAYAQHKQAKSALRSQERSAEQQRQDMLKAETERVKAETDAEQASSSKLAARNRARRASSLLATDQGGEPGTAGGKTTLGQ
jgi:hypothetical protein